MNTTRRWLRGINLLHCLWKIDAPKRGSSHVEFQIKLTVFLRLFGTGVLFPRCLDLHGLGMPPVNYMEQQNCLLITNFYGIIDDSVAVTYL